MTDRPVLVALRALKLGDFLTGLPALRALARAFPDHERVLAAPLHFSELARSEADCHRVVAAGEDLSPLPAQLGGAEVAVDLHGRGPASQLVLGALSPGRLVSFDSGLPTTSGSPRWRPDEHEVLRWCRLLSESGIAADPSDLALRHVPAPPARSRGATVVHPGAASPARRWPAGRFAAVARREATAGRVVVVTAGPGEEPLAGEVAARAGLDRRAVLTGRSLQELIGVIGGAGRVVCGDTGVAHLASATATPSVVLFGPVPPAEWGPPAHGPHVALWAGRRGDPHARTVDAGLLALSVADVVDALDRLPRPGMEAGTFAGRSGWVARG